jgi:hypothetical protein
MPASRTLTASEREWLHVRSYLQDYRYDLGVDAASEYPRVAKLAGTPLLAAAAWSPDSPISLQRITLALRSASADQLPPDVDARLERELLPGRADGCRYLRYSEVVQALAAPEVFENRSTYRLIGADLRSEHPHLSFTRGRYFDSINVGEAAAYEYARVRLGGRSVGLRASIADPCDPGRRPANLAVTTLTLRHDRMRGTAQFLLHWRDPAKVGHAGGLYQVVPVGMFQPSGEASHNEQNDFSLWRCMIREFAEELCGHSEEYGSEDRPIDYAAWPFARRLTSALDDGQLRAWCLGLGTDPLTYATDLLVAVVLDSQVFDELFSMTPHANAEGRLLAAQEFDARAVDRFVTCEPMQAAGAATLQLAWRCRDHLLA